MTNRTFSVANKFLELAERDENLISPLKIHKLVYIAHGWYLAIFDKPLLDEPVEAWLYGPVLNSLYHEFKRFGKDGITEHAKILVDGVLFPVPAPTDPNVIALIERIWEVYGSLSAYQLANLTHQPDTPWEKTKRGGVISNRIIRAHYAKKRAA